MKYSIITPVYNSFSLMTKYFDSLENQTYKDFEVILVDDCSTDDSYQNLVNYAESSPLDIKVLKNAENTGPGVARNIGLDEASGVWVTFIDNDDWVDETLLDKINNIIEKEHANCVVYDYNVVRDKKIIPASSLYYGENGIINLSHAISAIRNHAVGKFYKRDLIESVRYPKLRKCEDVAFVCQAIIACNSVYYYKEPLYYYVQRPGSLSNNSNISEIDMIKAFSILNEKFGAEYKDELQEKSVPDLLYGVLLMMCKANKPTKDIREYISTYMREYPRWRQAEILHHLGKAKRVFLICADMRFISGLRIISKVHSILIG